ncbi:MAG: acetyl-CoA carboxylase biotin carboxyl carrier protein [Flavobacteriales bacterium]
MELNEIQDLIKFVAKSNVSEVELESKGFKLVIKNKSAEPQYIAAPAPVQQIVQHTIPAAPVAAAPQAAPAPAAPAAVPAAKNSKYVTVKSPMIGTFYTKPSPDKPEFVKVGDDIKTGGVLCVIEAMKLFNEIESEVSGKIVEILVKDSSPVEYDQPLFVIDPS